MSLLRIDWCSFQAARFAVEHWHYSKSMPVGKTARVGAWWNGEFKGCAVFSHASSAQQHFMFGLRMEDISELRRVALCDHSYFHVSHFVSVAIKMVRSRFPGLRLIVSFADPEEGHVGRIYQAGNWIYTGETNRVKDMFVNGKRLHARPFLGDNFGRPKMKLPSSAVSVYTLPKHRYVMPLDKQMRRRAEKMRKPYPQPADAEVDGARLQPGKVVQAHPSAPGNTLDGKTLAQVAAERGVAPG